MKSIRKKISFEAYFHTDKIWGKLRDKFGEQIEDKVWQYEREIWFNVEEQVKDDLGYYV